MSTLFLIISILIPLICIVLLMLSSEEGSAFWHKFQFGCWVVMVISILLLLPLSIKSWEHKKVVLQNELLKDGVKMVTKTVPLNTKVIMRKVIINDGADLTYYEIIEGE